MPDSRRQKTDATLTENITNDLAGVVYQPSQMASSFTRKTPVATTLSPQSSVLSPQSSVLSPQSSALSPQSSALSPQSFGTLLAFDFGTKRIGISVGNTLLRRANPLTTIAEEKTEARFAAIAALLVEWQPGALVVGLPSNDDSTPHELTALCRRFANRLKGRFKLPVILLDERYTSLAASAQLNEEGIHGRKQKALLDQYAAQQILQAYFDEPTAGQIV